MGAADHLDQRHIGVRHPRPSPAAWRVGKAQSAGGRFSYRRVIEALKADEAAGHTDGMNADELAAVLGVANSWALKMAWSCWMAGLVQFDIELGDIVFRLVKD